MPIAEGREVQDGPFPVKPERRPLLRPQEAVAAVVTRNPACERLPMEQASSLDPAIRSEKSRVKYFGYRKSGSVTEGIRAQPRTVLIGV